MLIRVTTIYDQTIGTAYIYKVFYIDWYYNRWRKKAGGGSQPFSHHIGKSSKGFHYDLRKLFVHAQEWEHPLIRVTESAFTNLRKQNKLAAMRRALQILSRLDSEWQEQIRAMSENELVDF